MCQQRGESYLSLVHIVWCSLLGKYRIFAPESQKNPNSSRIYERKSNGVGSFPRQTDIKWEHASPDRANTARFAKDCPTGVKWSNGTILYAPDGLGARVGLPSPATAQLRVLYCFVQYLMYLYEVSDKQIDLRMFRKQQYNDFRIQISVYNYMT